MKHQQAVYLQEMGITRWQVRKPALFNNIEATEPRDLSCYSLLVICTDNDFELPLMSNILKAFKFSRHDVYHCSMAEFENHQGKLPEFIWSTMGEIYQVFGHKLLTSIALAQLENNPREKRVLWEQFCAFNE